MRSLGKTVDSKFLWEFVGRSVEGLHTRDKLAFAGFGKSWDGFGMIEIDGIIYNLQRRGGITTYFNSLVALLDDREYEYRLAVFGKPVGDVPAARSPLTRRARVLERYRKAPVAKDSLIFHSSYYRVPAAAGAVRSVVTVHDFIYERYARGVRQAVHGWQKRKAIKSADAVICVSESTADDLNHFVGGVKGEIHVIPNGVSEAFLCDDRQCFRQGSAKRQILYVGARCGYKNFELLALAMRYVQGASLICVGGGPFSRNEKSLFVKVGVDDVVQFDGVSNAQLNGLYNSSGCLAYPSVYEGFGIPVLEALRAGCPVVANVVCKAVREVGGASLIYGDNEPQSFAQAIEVALSHSRRDYIEAGFARAREFSWERTHSKTIAVYSGLMR